MFELHRTVQKVIVDVFFFSKPKDKTVQFMSNVCFTICQQNLKIISKNEKCIANVFLLIYILKLENNTPVLLKIVEVYFALCLLKTDSFFTF